MIEKMVAIINRKCTIIACSQGEYVEALKAAGVQAAMVKGKPHTGLCYYPTKVGRMHKGLKGYDYFGEMIQKCHENGIAVIAYFTQIFDNWAYEEHPSWRLVTAEGKKAGKGAVTLDGGMIDKPMELRARTTLAQAEAAGINVEGMVL